LILEVFDELLHLSQRFVVAFVVRGASSESVAVADVDLPRIKRIYEPARYSWEATLAYSIASTRTTLVQVYFTRANSDFMPAVVVYRCNILQYVKSVCCFYTRPQV
jgi:hypothetical protein